MSLLAVNMERYIAISWPLRHAQFVTRCRARGMIGIIWLINIGCLVGIGCASNWHIEFIPDHQVCDFASDNMGIRIVSYCSFLLFEAIPLFATFILYTRLTVIARQQANRIASLVSTRASTSNGVLIARRPQKRLDMKAATTFLYVTLALVVAWIPVHVVELMQAEGKAVPLGAVFFTEFLLVSNSWWNVVIYYFRNRAFRKAFRIVCGKHLPCIERVEDPHRTNIMMMSTTVTNKQVE
ncbi:adenosine receptor A2a-like [Amphiura filiformis]|uniref:adenosine receptor A2a-like n=1 Tax=Amphiura filiformis TaxID=82378 RepID=UPI003B211B40